MKLSEEQKQKAIELQEKFSDKFDEEEAEKFSKKHTDKSWYSDFKLLYDMVRDKSFDIPKDVYYKIIGTLAYVIFPIDIIPDFIPGAGWVDDIFVLSWVISAIASTITRYREHLKEKENNNV